MRGWCWAAHQRKCDWQWLKLVRGLFISQIKEFWGRQQEGKKKESKGQEAGGHAKHVSLLRKDFLESPTYISLVRTGSHGPLSCKGVCRGKYFSFLAFL